MNDRRSLVLGDEEGVSDTLTVENAWRDGMLCAIEIYEPWQGDSESGFGVRCTFPLTLDQAKALVTELQERIRKAEEG